MNHKATYPRAVNGRRECFQLDDIAQSLPQNKSSQVSILSHNRKPIVRLRGENLMDRAHSIYLIEGDHWLRHQFRDGVVVQQPEGFQRSFQEWPKKVTHEIQVMSIGTVHDQLK